jgi:hypothetical protein
MEQRGCPFRKVTSVLLLKLGIKFHNLVTLTLSLCWFLDCPGALLGIGVGGALLVVAAVSLLCLWWLRDRRRSGVAAPPDPAVAVADDSASAWDPEMGTKSYMPKKYSGASTGEISEPDTAYEGHSWASSGVDVELSLKRELSESAAGNLGRLEPGDVEFEFDETGNRRLLGQGTSGAVRLHACKK